MIVGLGAMLGAGLLLGLFTAAVVAYCNALSSAQLAVVYPESGGTYVYGRERLGPLWGISPDGVLWLAIWPVVQPWL